MAWHKIVAGPRAPELERDPLEHGLLDGFRQGLAQEHVAAAILGTTTLRDTINAAMHEVVHAKRRLELISMLSEDGRFDFDGAERAWGADE